MAPGDARKRLRILVLGGGAVVAERARIIKETLLSRGNDQMIGVDISPNMIKFAAQYLAEVDRVRYEWCMNLLLSYGTVAHASLV
jgi:spermidine synthase